MSKVNLCKGEVRYDIQQVFDALGEDALTADSVHRENKKDDIEFDGYQVHRFSLRYMTFYQKGVVCCKCGRIGSYFTLDKHLNDYDGPRRHFNLYADDGTLITKDHILAKSKGGEDKVDNMQTMCEICNKLKKDMTEEAVEKAGLQWGIELKDQMK